MTYGDGVSDIDHGKTVTVSVVHSKSRFGALEINSERVKAFNGKLPSVN